MEPTQPPAQYDEPRLPALARRQADVVTPGLRQPLPEPPRAAWYRRLHRRMRRYYPQIALVAIGFGAAGGLLGFRYGPRSYQAVAAVELTPVVSAVAADRGLDVNRAFEALTR